MDEEDGENLPHFEGWDMVRTLGEGAYGEVKLLINRKSQQAVALKILDLRECSDANSRNSVQKEVSLSKSP